jgi:hypothetical protein
LQQITAAVRSTQPHLGHAALEKAQRFVVVGGIPHSGDPHEGRGADFRLCAERLLERVGQYRLRHPHSMGRNNGFGRTGRRE